MIEMTRPRDLAQLFPVSVEQRNTQGPSFRVTFKTSQSPHMQWE